MNSPPELYKLANALQRRDAKEIIDEFSEVLQMRTHGRGSLIDVGCGTGDVLMDFIYPSLSETCTKFVGVDISPKMIQFSKNAYADCKKVDFKVLDIETEMMPLEYYEKFTYVTSFFCLHWIQNLRLSLKNIYNMLLNDGDCLLAFIVTTPLFDIYKTLAEKSKWSKYIMDIYRFLPPALKNAKQWVDYSQLLKETGFIHQNVTIRDTMFVFEGVDSFKEFLTSINPFIGRMPLYKEKEFMNDVFEHSKDRFVFTPMDHKDDLRCVFTYKLVVAYAKK